MKKFYLFLGSIPFAVTLIGLAAFFIIAGTWIESYTQSHRSAANLIYQNPVFKLLLILFFVNILVSALHRFPFRRRHVPFLITHFGLLMIIAGIFVKNTWGVQGSLELVEGGGSHHLIFPEKPAIYLENKAGASQLQGIDLPNFGKIALEAIQKPTFSDLKLELLGYTPHSSEKIHSWILDNQGVVAGLKPFLVHTWNGSTEVPFSTQVRLHHPKSSPWRLYALRTDKVEELVKAIYLQSSEVAFSLTSNEALLHHCSLKQALNQKVEWKEGSASTQLIAQGIFNSPQLIVAGMQQNAPYKIQVSLDGKQALLNANLLEPQTGKAPLSLDLVCTPSLAFIEDSKGDVHFFAFDSNGEVYSQYFPSNSLEKIIVYDHGFGGYFAGVSIPFTHLPNMRKEKEAAHLHQMAVQFRQFLKSNPNLPPPLKLFAEACQQAKVDFSSQLFRFLSEWDQSGKWVFPTDLPLLQTIDWKACPDFKACYWLSTLCHESNLADFLQEKKLTNEELTQTLFSLSTQLPEVDFAQVSSATLLSAYFRAYSIHLATLQKNFELDQGRAPYFAAQLLNTYLENAFAPLTSLAPSEYIQLLSQLPEESKTLVDLQKQIEPIRKILPTGTLQEVIAAVLPIPLQNQHFPEERILADLLTPDPVVLESPLLFAHSILSPLSKLEENTPLVKLKVQENEREEIKTLRFQPHLAGFKHPVLDGNYLIRLQAKTEEIPYHLRLRQARQISYAHSPQTYSYECDLLLTDRKADTEVETTLSMNHVYETWDGYRFYLANMTPATENSAKHVQIVVNYDPAKYLLTYPGAAILSIGILLLFWLNPYKR